MLLICRGSKLCVSRLMAKLLEPFNWYVYTDTKWKTIMRNLAFDKRTLPEWRLTSPVQCYFYFPFTAWRIDSFHFQLFGTGSWSLASPCTASNANQLKRLVADNERIFDHRQLVQTELFVNLGIYWIMWSRRTSPSPLYIHPYLLQCGVSERMYLYMVEKNIDHPGMDLI